MRHCFYKGQYSYTLLLCHRKAAALLVFKIIHWQQILCWATPAKIVKLQQEYWIAQKSRKGKSLLIFKFGCVESWLLMS